MPTILAELERSGNLLDWNSLKCCLDVNNIFLCNGAMTLQVLVVKQLVAAMSMARTALGATLGDG